MSLISGSGSRDYRETQDMVKVPLGIFWDIENCPNLNVLRRKSNGIAKGIREFIEYRHPDASFPLEFCCAWDTRNKEDISKRLSNNGVDVLYANATSKNAADEKLKEEIDKFIHQHGANALIVIITGDINFKRSIQIALQKGLQVVLIYGENASQALLNMVKESYFISEILDTIDDETNDDSVQTVTLKAYGWPTNIKPELIQKRLSMLSLNCGGKISELNEDYALINYVCLEDAQRSLKRMSGMDAFGKQLQIKMHNVVHNNNNNGNYKNDENSSFSFNNNNKNNNNYADSESGESDDSKRWRFGSPGGGGNSDRKPRTSGTTKSVITGLYTRKEENALQLARNLVKGWPKECGCDPIMIDVAFRNKKFEGKDGRAELFVTASSESANQKLVNGAKDHFNDYEKGIFWRLFNFSGPVSNDNYNHSYFDLSKYSQAGDVRPQREADPTGDVENFYAEKYAPPIQNRGGQSTVEKRSFVNRKKSGDECKSVIKGLDTRKDENVLHYVRKIVRQWNIDPSAILEVTRSNNFLGKNGKATLFVTAASEEDTRMIVSCALDSFNNAEKSVFWQTFSQHNGVDKGGHSEKTVKLNNKSANNGGGNNNNRKKNTNKNKSLVSNRSIKSLETFGEEFSGESEGIASVSASYDSNSDGQKILAAEKLREKLNKIRHNMKLFAGILYDLNPDALNLKYLYETLVSQRDKYVSNYFGVYNSAEMDGQLYAVNEALVPLLAYYENTYLANIKANVNGNSRNSDGDAEIDSCRTIVSGVWTDQDDDVLKLIQGEVERWDDHRVSADDIVSVGRDAKFRHCNGKVLLFVTARSREKSDLLLELADKNFNSSANDVFWKAKMIKKKSMANK